MYNYVVLFLVLSLAACANHKVTTSLTIELTPESYFGDYSITWKDTIGLSDLDDSSTFLMDRTNEIHCHIIHQSGDTLGYYRGMSMPGQWTYFQTKTSADSLIYLNFSIGVNHFSTQLATYSQKELRKFIVKNKNPIQFKPVEIYLDTALRKSYTIKLVE